MKIDYCLILAAGFGTRMGEIGKILPKVLWPIFEKPLLELEILYARSLGIKKIFINLHHQSELIIDFINSISHDDIIILYEPQLLDVGGAIQNLAAQDSVKYSGNLLVINSDQFLFFDKNYLIQGLENLNKYPVSLFMINVEKTGCYNQVKIKKSENNLFFSEIIMANNVVDNTFWTYSGNALVNLEKIPKVLGKSSFYNSVARYEKELIPVIKLEKLSYWDFGTLNRYLDSIYKIFLKVRKMEKDQFIDFLVNSSSLDLTKLDLMSQSYNSSQPSIFDFSDFNGPKILLNSSVEFSGIKVSL